MKISLKWLSDYVHLPRGLAPEVLAERLTLAGLEVEAITHLAAPLEGVVVAQVASLEKHPNADKLSLTRIDCGEAGPLQVVCGARNFKCGDKVALAKEGALLPNGLRISRARVRGVESCGMLCSPQELGFSEESDGLLLLDAGLKVGQPLAEALELDDVVLELNITPDRQDALCHLGIARDIAALFSVPLRLPEAPFEGKSSVAHPSGVGIDIRAKERCPRYAACVVEGLQVAPSPQWMRRRLEACGIRSINNLVDVTNYVLLEYGQPLHAFDMGKLHAQQMVVRLAQEGEVLATLDGKARVLSSEDLLICDGERPLALAGVMGGKDSEVSADTRSVLLECAVFSPTHIRKTAKRHALQTESSYRFERGVDISQTHAVLRRAAGLLAELGGGRLAGEIFEAYPAPQPLRGVPLRSSKLHQLLGCGVEEGEKERILLALGLKKQGEGVYEIPASRSDLLGEEDLAAEVARIYGYGHIPPSPPRMLRPAQLPDALFWERQARQCLRGMGLSEVVNYSFADPSHLKLLGMGQAPVALQNPLSAEMSVLRTSLFPGLLQNIGRAKRRQAESAALFEVGRSYFPRLEGGRGSLAPAVERRELAGLLWGLRMGKRTWTTATEAYDFYDIKGVVESLLGALKTEGVYFKPLEAACYHPRASASIYIGDKAIGSLGELHPRVAKRMDVPSHVFLFQLEFEKWMPHASWQPRPCASGEHPAVLRDLAVVLPRECSYETVVQLIQKAGAPLLEEVQLFDVYFGKPIPETQKSFAFALRYRSPERTLTDAEATQAHEKIIEEISRVLGGHLRV